MLVDFAPDPSETSIIRGLEFFNHLSSRKSLSPAPHPSSCRRARCARYAWWLRCCTHAMNASTPSTVDVRKGKTTSKSVCTCDTVRAGAFFPHVDLQVPQQEMRQHRRQPMVRPARICADFIVV